VSEQEIREGMLLAVWDEPPLDFDPDTLIRRVEQKKSRRRALVTVGVATAMIVVASLTVPGLLPRNPNGQLASQSPPSSSAPPSEPTDKRAQRVGDRLAEQLRSKMSSLKDVYATFYAGEFLQPPYPTSAPQRNPSDPNMSGYVHLTDHIGPTALRVQGIKSQFAKKSFCATAISCNDVPQQDGSTVTEAEFTDGGTEIARSEVVRQFESGYFVSISSYNHNPASGSGLRQTVPVRVGVLTDLVTDPGITWE
jgi:hypothetical protein